MKPPSAPPFLARENYRLRRLMDAARFLPVFGFVLLLLPLMREDPQTGTTSAAGEAVYLFLVWPALILGTFLMSRGLRKAFDPSRPPDATAPLIPDRAPDPDAARKD